MKDWRTSRCKRALRGAAAVLVLAGWVAGCASVESGSHETRMAALAKVRDERALYGYAIDERMHEDVRRAAFERLTRPDLLYLIVQDAGRGAEMRTAALGKIRDEGVLFRVAADKQFERTCRQDALDRIKDEELLVKVATDPSFDEGMREGALARVRRDAALLKVAQSPSAGMALRTAAARRVAGDAALAALLRTTGLPQAELRNALRKIADETRLGEVMADPRVDPALRLEAAQRVSSEALLAAYATDESVPAEDRERAALRLYSSEACEKGLRDGGLSEAVQFRLVEHVTDDKARVRLLRAAGVTPSVKRRLAENIGDGEALAGVLGDLRLAEDVRQIAAEALKRDTRRLAATFRRSRDLEGAVLALERLPKEATANAEDQKLILRWFKAAEQSGRKDAGRAMALLAGRMTGNGALWHVAEAGTRVPEKLRAECIARISDTNLLCRAAMRRGDSPQVRAAAVGALAGKGFDVHRLLGRENDAAGRILVLQHLPEREVHQPQIQRRLVEWFLQFGDSEDDLDARARLLGLLAPEAEVDGEEMQRKIARTLAARDSAGLRRTGRMLVVDPEAVEGLVCQDFGTNAGVAAWAAELIAGEAWIARAAERARDSETLCRLAARTGREETLANIARGDGPAEVRAAAAKRLGQASATLLKELAEKPGPDEAGVAQAALDALGRIDGEAAAAARERRAAVEREQAEEREREMAEREREDTERLARTEAGLRGQAEQLLKETYAALQVRSDIRMCRLWGRLQEGGMWISGRDVSFPGVVREVQTHWFGADEVWLDVECDGDRYRVYAKTADGKKAKVGLRMRVSGRFVDANASEVKLKKAVLSVY